MHQSCTNFKRGSKKKQENEAGGKESGSGGVKKERVAAGSALAIQGMNWKQTESGSEVPDAGSSMGTGTVTEMETETDTVKAEGVKTWWAAKYAGMNKRQLWARRYVLLDEKVDAEAQRDRALAECLAANRDLVTLNLEDGYISAMLGNAESL